MNALMVAFNKKIATEFQDKLSQRKRPQQDWTPQQRAFIHAFTSTSASIFGEAVAGSGKTTVLLAAALDPTLSASWTCKTLHGLGYGAWADKLGKRLSISGNKSFKLLKEMNDSDNATISDNFGDILKLVAVAKNSGLVPSPRALVEAIPKPRNPLAPDDESFWSDLADFYDLAFSPEILLVTRQLLARSILAAHSGQLDFDDMLYMPTCFGGIFTRYELVCVDEAQDLSAIQHDMLSRSVRKDGRLIGCGDRHQAIYGFRGALADSIPQMISRFNMELLPLTVSFRCPRAVVREAQKSVPHIEAFDGAREGRVIHHTELPLEDAPQTVLCRNTAPLVQLALRLIASGRPATIAGREIGKSLSRLARESIRPSLRAKDKVPAVPLQALRDKITARIEAKIAQKPSREGRLRDQQAALSAIIDRAQSLSPSADSSHVFKIIEELYNADNPGAVHLSTVHKAKGLEWPEVLLLDPQLIPSKYAHQPWQLEQEQNIRYVAVTRAQRTLHFAHSDDII